MSIKLKKMTVYSLVPVLLTLGSILDLSQRSKIAATILNCQVLRCLLRIEIMGSIQIKTLINQLKVFSIPNTNKREVSLTLCKISNF